MNYKRVQFDNKKIIGEVWKYITGWGGKRIVSKKTSTA